MLASLLSYIDIWRDGIPLETGKPPHAHYFTTIFLPFRI